MITVYDLMEAADITGPAVTYRIKQMRSAGVEIPVTYNKYGKQTFPDEFLGTFVDWQGRKPGRKKGK